MSNISSLAILATLLMAIQGVPAKAESALPVQYGIEIPDVTVQTERHYLAVLTNKPLVQRDKISASAMISATRVDGKTYYTLGYSTPWSAGCKINGRFSFATPLYDIGSKTSDRLVCKDSIEPGSTTEITMTSSSVRNGDTISFSSTMKTKQRASHWGNDVTASVNIVIKIEGSRCSVLELNLSALDKASTSKDSTSYKTASYSKNCTLR
ncbi:hypothetical protein [Rhizobium sp. CF080]|uniref:hypothetical protein n=1 Tax=Rhizobium sp. (strain CF080) TaxID=1144310 RepID=UPI0012DF03D0|nr:hypothetical protein [Rhizobium sp. CF080]